MLIRAWKATIPSVLEWNAGRRRWEFTCDYAARHIAKRAGFYWLPELRCWVTQDRSRAARLLRYAGNDETRASLSKTNQSEPDSMQNKAWNIVHAG